MTAKRAGSKRASGLALALMLAASQATAQDAELRDADYWVTRMADAMRIRETLSAQAHVAVNHPGREDDFAFDMQMLRAREGDTTRTLMEMREVGDPTSVVTELVEKPGEPLTSWYWDLQKRRWLAVRGLQATDPFADTTFRYEDLWFTDPSARRKGTVKWVEEAGRRLIEIESAPYHYYLRVHTRIDPDNGLPLRVRFIDNTGTPIREQSYDRLTLVDGKPFPSVVQHRDLTTRSETTITYGEMRFGSRIPPSFFDLSVIDDRIKRGSDPVPDLPELLERTPHERPDAAAPGDAKPAEDEPTL